MNGYKSKLTKNWSHYQLQDNHVVQAGKIHLKERKVKPSTINESELYKTYLLAVFNDDNRQLMLYAIITEPQHASGILCTTTGEIFSSIEETAIKHHLRTSTLRNHLNKKIGFDTVNGKIYKKLIPMLNDQSVMFSVFS